MNAVILVVFRTDLAEDENGYTIVHTDGACSDNGKKGARHNIAMLFSNSFRLIKGFT